jgi:hypothetical protein
MELVEFLRTRLDEDEQRAKAATPGPWMPEGDDDTDDEVWTAHDGEHGELVGDTVAYVRGGERMRANVAHIARHDPARVLAEVDAKRRIIAECERTLAYEDHGHAVAEFVLQGLALPYADHPDFREEWRA